MLRKRCYEDCGRRIPSTIQISHQWWIGWNKKKQYTIQQLTTLMYVPMANKYTGLKRLFRILGVFGLAHTWVYILVLGSCTNFYFFLLLFFFKLPLSYPRIFFSFCLLDIMIRGLYHIDEKRKKLKNAERKVGHSLPCVIVISYTQ